MRPPGLPFKSSSPFAHDIRALFRSLKAYKVDDTDNGTVRDHKPY